jgi:hypothetical protein
MQTEWCETIIMIGDLKIVGEAVIIFCFKKKSLSRG